MRYVYFSSYIINYYTIPGIPNIYVLLNNDDVVFTNSQVELHTNYSRVKSDALSVAYNYTLFYRTPTITHITTHMLITHRNVVTSTCNFTV